MLIKINQSGRLTLEKSWGGTLERDLLVAGHEAEDFSVLAVHTPVLAQWVARFLENFVQYILNLFERIVHSKLAQDMLVASHKTEDFLIILVLFHPCRTQYTHLSSHSGLTDF